MATVPEDSPILEVRHKSQQSHDSGAYIDWSVEESTVIKEQAYQSNVTGEFVTVVAVETANQIETQEKSFVTVLSIGDTKATSEPLPDSEEVLVYRLPGERLGFGLKFEGGLKTAEKVNRLFIQSCAPDSPASRTRCSWGPLSPGDEILEIDGIAVKDMTRIDCVRSLKESHVVIKLRIRPASNDTVKSDTDKNDKQSSPPPIPPRKMPRKSGSFKETASIVCPPDGFADNDNSGSKEAVNKNFKTNSPREVCKNNHDDVIRQHVPEAEVYMDLIAKESEMLPGESESDDTGSSISTVVDRLSSAPTTSNSSFSDVRSITSLDITTPPTPTSTNTCPTFDLDRVLEPFLQLEREFSSSATIDESSLFNKLVAAANFTETSHTVVTRTSSVTSTSVVEESVALQPPACFQDGPTYRESLDTEISEELISKEKHCVLMKTSPRKTHSIVLHQNLEIDDESEIEMQRDEDMSQTEFDAPALPPKPSPRKDLSQKSKFKSGKKRPPPPPPPRFDRPCPNPPNENHNNDIESDEFNDTLDSADSQNEIIGHHLPRLIDFVPKDRTDVLVPNVIHPENSQQNHMEMLIQRQRLLEMGNTKPGADNDESSEHKTIREVGSVRMDDEPGHSDTTSDGEEHCTNIPMCVPAHSDDESDIFPGHSILPHLSTIGEDEEDSVDDRTDIVVLGETSLTVHLTDANGGIQRDPGVNTHCQGTADVDSLPIPCKPLSDEKFTASSSLETNPSNGVEEKLAKSLDSGVYGAMDALATATLSLSPPPSFSRMPPDGHEFPPNYQEPCPEPITSSPNLDISLKMVPPPLPTSAPPPITKKKPTIRTSLEIGNEPTTNAVRKFSTCSNVSSTDEIPVRPSTRSSAWRNDEKSERSVRDKIAMFSNVPDESPISPVIAPPAITLNRKLNRFKSSEDVFLQTDNVDCSSGSFPSGKLFSRSVLSVDKVASHTHNTEPIQSPRKPMKKSLNYNSMMDVTQVAPSNHQNKPSLSTSLEFGSRTQSSMDLTSSSSSSSAYSSCSPDSSLTSTISSPYTGYSSTLPRKSARENERKSSLTSSTAPSLDNNKPVLTRAMSFTGGNKLHSRSQSLVDVNASLVSKYVPNSTIKGSSEEARRASLNALIEQRRRSISKLRGLVIPERVAEVTLPQPIIDLPEIKSRDSVISKICPPVAEEPVRRLSVGSTGRAGTTSSSPVCANYINAVSAQNNLTSPPWKSQTPVTDLPKYSPAFKRKSLAVYGAPSSASSVSSSLSSSREELRPLFENSNSVSVSKPVNNVPPTPPSKPPRTTNRQSYSSQSTVLPLSPMLPHTEPPKSLESITSPTRSDMSFEFVSSSGSSPDVKMMKTSQAQFEEKSRTSKSNNYKNGIHEPQVMPLIKLTSKHRISTDVRRSGGEESDNDSAVSSSRSSISHDYSPPQSPLPDNNRRIVDEDSALNHSHTLLSPSNSTSSGDRRTLRRTLSSETTASAASSTASTLTSGSQASCSSSSSDSMSRRVLKAQSVEAINRKNVLSSARFSSGQDLKVGSPLIQRKFDGNGELSKNLNYSDSSSFTVDSTEECTESFINKLNKTLQKEDHNDVEQSDDSIDKTLINYQLTSNKEYTINSTKVAYLEVEVVDGAFSSSQEDSSFIDSNPSSMENLDSESVPVPREICPENENIVLNVNLNNSDSSDNITEAREDIYNECLTDHYQPTTKSLCNLLDEEEIVVPKPVIKRLSRDHKINCDITTAVVPDNYHKTASIEFLNNEKNSEEIENAPEEKIIPEMPPKPTQRMANLDYIPDSLKKEELTEVETDAGKQSSVTNRVKEQAISPTSKIPTASVRSISNRRSVSVNDIRKAFEKAEMSLGGNRVNKIGINGTAHQIPSHVRVSSLDSTTSEDSCAPTPTHYGSITNLQKEQQFGSITSLASSTSLISQQELQQLIDDANQTLEETGGCSHEVVVVILHRDTAGGSIGITLAGGADYESKEITVHKVLAGSPADRDGRIQKGDRILSINGRSMKGVSHRESLTILKAPRPEVVLVVSRWRPDGYIDSVTEDPLVLSLRNTLRPPRIPEQLPEIPAEILTNEKVPEETTENISRGPAVTVTLVKDGAGLGFSLEGGKDSPFGDQPLTIKKIFTGGCAEKSCELYAGDELLSVNGTDVTTMSRIEAWGLMKRLADGKVVLSVRHKVANSGQ